eukprot:SAG11_NODE_36649_length_260_cov_1.273292_1_plen_46_part_10
MSRDHFDLKSFQDLLLTLFSIPMRFAYNIRPRYFRRIIIILYRRTP